MSRGLKAVYVLGAVVGAGWLVHRVGIRSGVSDAEARQQLPGDEVVGHPQWQSTRAVTIDASPAAVWPWIVQMGFPDIRAGWYTPYWLDHLVWRTGARSADEIIPELQELEVGDEVSDSADGAVFWTVEALAPERHLVLRTIRHIIPPIRTVDSSWAVVLKPIEEGNTRLYLRARAIYTPRWIVPFVEIVIGPADWLNGAAMLADIRRRAEGRK